MASLMVTHQPLTAEYGQEIGWAPRSPRYRLLNMLVSWLVAAVAVPKPAPSYWRSPALTLPTEPIVGGAGIHDLLTGWRRMLQSGETAAPPVLTLDARGSRGENDALDDDVAGTRDRPA